MSDMVQDKVIELIAKAQNLEPDHVSIDATFADLGMDSLDAFSLIADLEDEYSVEIPSDEAMTIKSVRQAVDALEKLIAARSVQ